MGNHDSSPYKPAQIYLEQWQQKESNSGLLKMQPEYGYFKIYHNKLTNEEIEEYILTFFNQQDYESYLKIYEWREHQDHIVNTRYLQKNNHHEFCSTSYACKVYTQHIPARLSSIEDIPFPDNLYVLHSCLQGFEKLYKLIGYFKISEDLICIDKDGKVKVWRHPDLSKNYLFTNNVQGSLEESRNHSLEESMVMDIIELINENTDNEGIERQLSIKSLKEFIFQNAENSQILTFTRAKAEIVNYANQCKIEMPHYFESLVNIFNNPGDQWQSDLGNKTERYDKYQNQGVVNQNEGGIISNKIVHYVDSSQVEGSNLPYQYQNSQNNIPMSYESHLNVPQGVHHAHNQFTVQSKVINRSDASNQESSYRKLQAQPYQHQIVYSHVENQPVKISSLRNINQPPTPTFVNSNFVTFKRPEGPTNLRINFNYQGASGSSSHVHPIRQLAAFPPSSQPQIYSQTLNYQIKPHEVEPLNITQSISSPTFLPIQQNRLHQTSPFNETNAQGQQNIQYLNMRNTFSYEDNFSSGESPLRKVLYSDSNDYFELDPEIAQDMLKFLKEENRSN